MDNKSIIECAGFYFIHNFDSGNLGHVEQVPTELIGEFNVIFYKYQIISYLKFELLRIFANNTLSLFKLQCVLELLFV